MTHFTDTTIIEMRIVKAKPEFIWHLLHQVETLKTLYEKSGVKVLAIWMTQAGAIHELITLVQYESFAKRVQYKDMRMADKEWVNFDCVCAKYYTETEDFVCKTSVNLPKMETIKPRGKYLIQMYRSKGFLPFDSKKLFETSKELETIEGSNACKTVAILIPFMCKFQCIITIREWPEDSRVDAALNAHKDAVFDPKNWTNLYDVSKTIRSERCVLVRGIPFDKIPCAK